MSAHLGLTVALAGSVVAAVSVLLWRALRRPPRGVGRLDHALRLLVIGGVAGVALVATSNAHASGTINIGAATGFSLNGATFAGADSAIGGAVSGGTGLDLPVSIPDLQQMPVSNVSYSSDATNHTLALQGDVTLQGQGVSIQLSALWDTASSTTPHIAVAVKPTATSLQSLNALWASAPVNPTVSNVLLVASPSAGYSFDPSKLPTAAQAFYPHLNPLTAGPGLTLAADVDASTDQNFSNALHYLGEGTQISLVGQLSGSVAPLFGGATQAQESGLDLTITVNGAGPGLPSWITARTSSVEFKLTGTTPAVTIADDITTNLNGKVNEFAGSLSYDAGALGGPTVDFQYGLKPGSPPLQIPFGLDSLSLSNTKLDLSMTTGATKTFSGTLDTDVSAGGSTVHLNAGITIGSGSSVSGTFGITGPITMTDAANFANALLGLSVPTGSLGTDISLNSITFSFSKDATSQSFSLDASATVRSLTADVLLSIRHTAPNPPTLVAGLHLADAGSSCNCITVSKLLGGTLSDLTQGLQLPAVNVFTSIGFGNGAASVDVPTASLSSVEQGFFQHIWSTLPSTISFGPKLTLSATLTLPDAVSGAFGMATGSQVVLNGDLGFGLDQFGGASAPSLGASITATLPPITSNLPSWISSTGNWTLSLGVNSNTVQLGVGGSLTATVQGTQYPITVDGTVSKSGSNVDVAISGSVTATFSNLFGLSWLSVTNPSISLHLHHGGSGTSFDGSLAADVTVGTGTAHVIADVSTGDGTQASLEVTSTSSLSSTDVAGYFGITMPANAPTLTLDSLDAKAVAGAATKSLDVVANTTLHVNGHDFSSSLLISLGKDSSAGHVVVGFRPTTTVKLSDLISSLPSGVDFSFPTFALVLAHPSTTLTFANLLPDEQTFFQPFCGDSGSPCNSTLSLNDGLSIVAAVTMPSSLTGLLDSVHVDPAAPGLITGTLPIFGGPQNLALNISLPSIPATDSIPDMFESGSLSMQLTSTSLALTGSLTFNIPKGHITDAGKCTSLGGVMRSARGTTEAPHCFDQVPFDVTTALTVSPPSMTLTGGLHSGYAWQAPLDVEWLSLNKATIELGVSVSATGPTFTLGFAIGATVANHDFLGALKASISPTPNPPFFVINPQGFRISSNSGLSIQDLVDLGTAVSGKSLTLGGVPNIAVRNVDLRWSETTDTALCLPQGLHIAADLYINPSSSPAPAVAGCPDDSGTESNRTTACVNDASNGCFASVDIGIDDKGIHASGNLGSFNVGPISFGGALVDAELTSDVQRLLIKGSMSIQGFASGSLDLLVGTTNLHFRGSVQLFGSAFDAYLDGDASINLAHLTDLTNPPAFSVKAVLKSDFLSQAGVALAGTLQTLKPAIQALDVVLTDLANNDLLSAIVDVPAQIAKLGVNLPDPYGSALGDVATKLADIKSAISGFGHAVNWGLNDLLNGFDLSFPGIPGTIQPSSPTCVTDWVNGTCYSVPPACFGLLGCTDGIPGVVVYPTCLFTMVNGTCYSVPPITGVHIPGLCSLVQQAIPSLSCTSTSFIDDLIMPALRSAFKSVTGYDIGTLSLSSVLDSISNALGSGSTFSIDCAEFDAHVGASNGTPSAGVALAAAINLFGNHYNYGVSWNFSVTSGNVGQAILDIINSIIHPSTGNTCALPADWNSNADYPGSVGTAPNTGTPGTAPPVTPTMSLSPAASPVNEGSAATVNGSVSPAPAATETVNLTWGDGSSSTTTVGTAGTFSAAHTYGASGGADEGQFAIHASISGGPSTGTMVTIANVTPSSLVLTPSSGSINEGDSITMSGSFVDPSTADTHTVAINWGDGGTSSLTLAAGVKTFTSGSHTYVDNNGTLAGYPASVTVTDDDNTSTTTTTTVNVANVAPKNIVITPSVSSTPEKQIVSFAVGFADPGVLDTETVLVDWGDGTAKESLSIATVRSFNISHQWSEADTAAHPDGKFPVSVTITDKDGGVGTATYTETVTNVAPNHLTVSVANSTINEGRFIAIGGNFADASGADTHTVTVDWGVGWLPSERYTTLNLAAGVFGYTANKQYGDDGTYTITVTVADDDGASTSASTVVTILNVPPTGVIDRSTTTAVQGAPTFLGHAGKPITLSEHSTDPGSDDLTMLWNWADGSTTSTTYLNNPPNPDPPNSPQVNPRDVVDTHAHTWLAPCVYNAGLKVTDDDGGTATDSNYVVVTGNATAPLSAGQWKQQYSGKGNLSPATLACYLQIANYMSGVFGDVVNVNSSADAMNILQPSSSDPHALLDRELLVTWLNFANGVWDWNTLVNTDGDGIPDTAFNVVLSAAERARLNPAATKQQLLNQRNLLNVINGDA